MVFKASWASVVHCVLQLPTVLPVERRSSSTPCPLCNTAMHYWSVWTPDICFVTSLLCYCVQRVKMGLIMAKQIFSPTEIFWEISMLKSRSPNVRAAILSVTTPLNLEDSWQSSPLLWKPIQLVLSQLNTLWWVGPGWVPGVHQSHNLSRTGKRK